ncbi:hypothetical protein GE061_008087 [Apolygus lucorum]|uniref:C2H2-type domain-containing protein n=1 Tax=Apolygus lucorum TaxID=248454 RepID=A0A6A4IWR5_APOLU|nr:hypothetical protein GE061_008087 [Apolygus lucorum]
MASGSKATRDGAGKKLEELLYSGNGCEFVTVKVEPVSSDDDHQKEFFYDSEDSRSSHPPVPVKKEPYVVDVDLLYTGSSDDSDDQRPSKLPKIHDVEVKEEPPQIEYDVPILDMVDWAAALKESSTSRKRPSRSNESTTNESSVAPIILPITPLNKIFLGYDSEEEAFKPPAQAKPAPKRWRKIYRPESKMKRYATVSLSRLDESVVQSGTVTLPLSTPKPVAARPPKTFVGRGRTRKEKFEGPKGSLSSAHKGNMKSHIRTHTKEKPWKCDSCDLRFSTSSGLKNHKMNHEGVRRFQCDMCDYRSVQEVTMKQHVDQVHLNLTPYQCHECGYRCYSKRTLRLHIVVHMGTEYRCKMPGCSYLSDSRRRLADHKRKHAFMKPFCCKQCPFESQTTALMTKHLLCHTVERRFKCTKCSFSSGFNYVLQKHKLLHSNH